MKKQKVIKSGAVGVAKGAASGAKAGTVAKVVAAVAAAVAPAPSKGLCCPRCECRHVPVYYTRGAFMGRIRRVRECRACGHLFVTLELVQK